MNLWVYWHQSKKSVHRKSVFCTARFQSKKKPQKKKKKKKN